MSAIHENPVPERYLDAAKRPGSEAALRARLPAKLRSIGDTRLVGLAKEAFGYATHPAISGKHKAMAVAALLYLVAPLDAIADWIPVAGYADDAAVLTALVVSLREAAKEVVSHTQRAADEVVSRAISEAREAWARRGVTQICLSLWSATAAACVGLLYAGSRAALEGGGALTLADPYLWACAGAGALGLAYHLHFAWRVWSRWSAASSEIREPLAWAIVSLADWRQVVLLALPVAVLAAALALRASGVWGPAAS
jgi:uncharacterized membrane protein YkvA (DUF1232 family)